MLHNLQTYINVVLSVFPTKRSLPGAGKFPSLMTGQLAIAIAMAISKIARRMVYLAVGYWYMRTLEVLRTVKADLKLVDSFVKDRDIEGTTFCECSRRPNAKEGRFY